MPPFSKAIPVTDATAARARPLRADAARNRERLIEIAKAAFVEIGPEVSLEAIARRADVGIGTLYRHFPSRDAVIEAVYAREIEQVTGAAAKLLKEMAPVDALAAWLRLSVDYMAAKKLIAPVFGTHSGGTGALYAQAGSRFHDAVRLLVGAALKKREIRPDVTADDLIQALTGLSYGVTGAGGRESTLRLIDVLIAGLKVKR